LNGIHVLLMILGPNIIGLMKIGLLQITSLEELRKKKMSLLLKKKRRKKKMLHRLRKKMWDKRKKRKRRKRRMYSRLRKKILRITHTFQSGVMMSAMKIIIQQEIPQTLPHSNHKISHLD